MMEAERGFLEFPRLNGMKTAIVGFLLFFWVSTALGAEPRTVTIVTTGGKDNVYNEGSNVTFQVSLSEANDTGSTLYAFLVAGPEGAKGATKDKFRALGNQCVITPDMTADDWRMTRGLVINPDNDGPDNPVTSTVRLLDGENESFGGSSFHFTVALCTTYSYDPATMVAGYDSNVATIRVLNVEPTIRRIEMNGYEPSEDGHFIDKHPVDHALSFQAIVRDSGALDLDNGFHTRWTITRVGDGGQILVDDIEGDPNDAANKKSVTFSQAGIYKIKVQVRDKDMDDWSETSISEVYVEVISQPQLSLVVPEVVNEDATRQWIEVGLGGFFGTYVCEPIVVMLTVIPPVANAANPGILAFDSYYERVPAGFEALANAAIASEGSGDCPHYFIDFCGDYDEYLRVAEMDGTDLSRTSGFSIKAQVLNDSVSCDPAKTWAQYYLPTTRRFYINNVKPNCTYSSPPEGTNHWELSSAVATSFPIRWTVRGDVDNDYAGLWGDGRQRGIKISFTGCENADDGLCYVTNRVDGASGVFVPNFGSHHGERTVTMTIEDKDGAVETCTYRFMVEPKIPELAIDTDEATVNATIDAMGFADVAVKTAIGGSAAEYTAFKTWANGVKSATGAAPAGETAVIANEHAATAYLLGAKRLFENEPTVEIGGAAAAKSAAATQMKVDVAVKDGESVVLVDAAKVAAMFEATSALGDWDGAAKLTPNVTASGTDASGRMSFTVIPGDGAAARAFLRIKR